MAPGAYMGAAQANAVVGSDVQIPRYGQQPAPQAQGWGYPGPGQGYGGYGGYGRGYGGYQAPPVQPRDHRWNGAGGAGGFREPTRWEWERRHPYGNWHERERRRNLWESRHGGIPFVGAEAIAEVAEANGMSGGTMPVFAPGPTGIVAQAAAYGIAPRAALVEAAPPTMGNRQVLPMNTGNQNVDVGLTAIITSRPQRVAFRPERVFVSATGTSTQGAAAWLINDITIGNRSQYVQQGALPGDMFATGAIDSFITFETAQTAMDVTMSVTFNDATVSGGQPFYGSLIGTAAM